MDKSDWYEHALKRIGHPVALVAPSHKFIWCNTAYEELVGYSMAELKRLTWMDVTEPEDVGGDLAAAESIIGGQSNTYTTEKHYKTKMGQTVPVVLTVWRFPTGDDPLVGFSVEAVSEHNTKEMVRTLHAQHEAEISLITDRVNHLESRYKQWTAVTTAVLRWLPLITALGAAAAWFLSQ